MKLDGAALRRIGRTVLSAAKQTPGRLHTAATVIWRFLVWLRASPCLRALIAGVIVFPATGGALIGAHYRLDGVAAEALLDASDIADGNTLLLQIGVIMLIVGGLRRHWLEFRIFAIVVVTLNMLGLVTAAVACLATEPVAWTLRPGWVLLAIGLAIGVMPPLTTAGESGGR